MPPYVYDRPLVADDPGAARDSLTRELFNGLLAARSYALCGGPKMGRTTLLLSLQTSLNRRRQERPAAQKFVAIYLDMAATLAALRPRRPGPHGFVRALWTAVQKAVLEPKAHGRDPPPRFAAPTFLGDDVPWSTYAQTAATLWEMLRGTTGWCRYVLLLDGGDILHDHQHRGLAGALAKLVRGGEPWAPASMVIAGGRRLRDLTMEMGSPLRFLRFAGLSVQSLPAFGQLLKGGDDWLTEETRAWLLAASGRHPYVVQRLLAELRTMDDPNDIGTVLQATSDDLRRLFEAVLGDLGPAATSRGEPMPVRALLEHLIERGVAVDAVTAEHRLGLGSLHAAIERLAYLGLVTRELASDRLHLRAGFGLWNDWYCRARGLGEPSVEP